MAGERIGKTYEALLKVILDYYSSKKKSKSRVFWNETPEGLTVEPDFVIGSDKNHPECIIMVTHSGSSKNSDMKCWRNIGELCEAKTVLSSSPIAINVVFDSVMKENIKELQAAAFDGQVIVGDLPFGSDLIGWVADNEPDLPTDQVEKALIIKNSLNTDARLKRIVFALSNEIDKAINLADDSILRTLWEKENARKKGTAPQAKDTFLRRGFTKRLLLYDALIGNAINQNDAQWLTKLGLVTKTISGYRISDPELKWFMNSDFNKNYKRIAASCASAGFNQQIEKVKTFALLDAYRSFCEEHYRELITSGGMKNALIRLHANPSDGIQVPDGVTPPQAVWLYDYIAAITKAAANRAQAFGYSAFSTHKDAKKSYIGNMSIGQWCSHFSCEFFNRSSTFTMPEEALEYISVVLSEQLKNYTPDQMTSLASAIEAQYISKEYSAILLAHRGFEPLLGLLIDAKVVDSANSKINIRTCFAEKAGLTGQAGKTTVIKVHNTIINWQTATDSGRDHKRKELSGRAVGLRYSWDPQKREFITRPGVKKLILLLDGTWRQKDIDALIAAGWDEIFYPDEVSKLKAAII